MELHWESLKLIGDWSYYFDDAVSEKYEVGRMDHNEEHQKEFSRTLNLENAKRLQFICALVLLVVTLQAVIYLLKENSIYGSQLIITKFAIIAAGLIVIFLLEQIKKEAQYAVVYSTLIISFSVFVMIFMAILNTFAAQAITNDISIYMMVLMATIAGNRMKPKYVAMILILNFVAFAIGMPFYQKNPNYLFSHMFNAAFINILAFLISNMFYNYSLKTYEDKLKANQINMQLKILSEKDDLTGLYNKRTIYKHLRELIDENKGHGKQVYLGILDLDHFKEINDHYGHLYGDEVLKQIASKIQSNVRQEDMVGRYGGDEFVIVFSDCDGQVVRRVMERIQEEVNKLDFEVCQLSFSCGVAVWNGESSEKLFERADAFMYDVKRSGKNNIKVESYEVVNL